MFKTTKKKNLQKNSKLFGINILFHVVILSSYCYSDTIVGVLRHKRNDYVSSVEN